jgi:hypothetical protein
LKTENQTFFSSLFQQATTKTKNKKKLFLFIFIFFERPCPRPRQPVHAGRARG